MKAPISIPISHVMSNITMEVKVTGLVKWRFQFWIAEKLFKLGAFILNIDIDFKKAHR